jgi:hypothetical protein
MGTNFASSESALFQGNVLVSAPTAPAGGDGLRKHFLRLHRIIEREAPLSQRLRDCARYMRRRMGAGHGPFFKQQLENAAEALERAAGGDFSGIGEQFRRIITTPAEQAEEQYCLVLVVKDIDGDKPPHPLILRCSLDRRTLEAQALLRAPEYIGRLAERLGVESFPPAALSSRVQGVNILDSAGYVRYAVFADLV